MSNFPVLNGNKLWYCHSRTSSSGKRKITNQLPSERKCLFKQPVLAASTGNGYLPLPGMAQSPAPLPLQSPAGKIGTVGGCLTKAVFGIVSRIPEALRERIGYVHFPQWQKLCSFIDSVKFTTNALKNGHAQLQSLLHIPNDKCLQHCPLPVLTTGMGWGQGRGRAERKGHCWVSSDVLLSFFCLRLEREPLVWPLSPQFYCLPGTSLSKLRCLLFDRVTFWIK